MELIKKALFSFSMSIMLIILSLLTLKIIKLKTTKIDITFPQKSEYQENYEKLYESIETITNNECKESIKNEILSFENLFFNNNMSQNDIRKKIESNNYYINDIIENCNLDSNNKSVYSLLVKYSTSISAYADLELKYANNYQLTLNDIEYLNNDSSIEALSSWSMSARLKQAKSLEIESLESLIEVIKNEE